MEGQHAFKPADVPGEKPLLINPIDPTDDDPKEHLGVNTATGVMTWTSPRGKMCVDIFGLNERDQLVNGRRGAAAEIKARFLEVLSGSDNEAEEAIRFIKEAINGHGPFTLARRAQYEKLRQRFGSLF